MVEEYDSATIQAIDQALDTILLKSSVRPKKFSSFDDLYLSLAEGNTDRAFEQKAHVKQEPAADIYVEADAMPLLSEVEEDEVMILAPISIASDRKIKTEPVYRSPQPIQYNILQDDEFDRLYNRHVKIEEETDLSAQNEQIDSFNATIISNGAIDAVQYENDIEEMDIPVRRKPLNNTNQKEFEVPSRSGTRSPIRAKKTHIFSLGTSLDVSHEASDERDEEEIIEDGVEFDLNQSVDRPSNDSQDLYITGMNIKESVKKDIFNDDDDFQIPTNNMNNHKEVNRSGRKPNKIAENSEEKSKEKIRTMDTNKRNRNDEENRADAQKEKKQAKKIKEIPRDNTEALNKKREQQRNSTNNKKTKGSSTNKVANGNKAHAENGSESQEPIISRSKRRVVLENMNRGYNKTRIIEDAYGFNKKKKTESTKKIKKEEKIIQRWTLYCWGRRGFMHHSEQNVPLLKHRNLIVYYKTLLEAHRPRVDVDKIRSSSPSFKHVLALDMSVIPSIINLGDKLTLFKQTAFVNKRGIQYKGKTFMSIEEWAAACSADASQKEDLATLIGKIEVNKNSLKHVLNKAKPPIKLVQPHLFLQRNVNRFIEVARKRANNRTLFSNLDAINWPPEEEPARYIYPMDQIESGQKNAPKRRVSIASDISERPKKRQKITNENNTNKGRVEDLSRGIYVDAGIREKRHEEKKSKHGTADSKPKKPVYAGIKENALPVVEKAKENPIRSKNDARLQERKKKLREKQAKDRESPILEPAPKIRQKTTVEKPKAIIRMENGNNNNNAKLSNSNNKAKEVDPKSSLRDLVSKPNTQLMLKKGRKSTWLKNIKPSNNNSNEKEKKDEIGFSLGSSLTTNGSSAEKQVIVEEDDRIYNEFFS